MLPSDALAGAPAGPRRLDAAHCEQAPFMYEMKGALFACAVHLLFLRRPHGVHRIRAVIHGFIHSLSTLGLSTLGLSILGTARRAQAPGRPRA